MSLIKMYADDNFAFQATGYTCGPTTLLNILRQKGDNTHTEEGIAKACKATSDHGTTVENLVAGAKELGLQVVETKKDAEISDIESNIDSGNTVVVNYFYAFSGEGHYAQIVEYDDEAFYFLDPSLGYMRLKKKYFLKNWYDQHQENIRWFMAIK